MSINKENLMIGLIAIVLIIAMSSAKQTSTLPNIQGGWDMSKEVKEAGYEKYLVEEPDFDYYDADIYTKAQNIKATTSSPEEAVKETIKFVYQTVRYSGSVSIDYCYNEKASTVLKNKYGDCVSMSRLVLSLLRAQGIPARTMGGCLSQNKRCNILFSTIPFQEAQTTDMTEGDFKKRGFLHEWTEVWLPSKNGWFITENTAGQTYDLLCNTYLEYGYDSNNINRCTITDSQFWETCKGY